ncbi:transcription factor bHLH126-like [Hibiscus syriacus]|uniref:transcription factor bHLH126-like n=1 Tax=Hibiscus syriacus TaxID=106335 RepID=UPI00192135DF|nr:transcription factor bHLH126-like [Hibiscus syriacus]
MDEDGIGGSHLYSTMGSRGRQAKLLAGDNGDGGGDDDKKKSMHRDIERQRRQEMATLYASFRTLLPLEYIKGKRAVSDHMNRAVIYIKELQKRIRELSSKRDELKKLSDSSFCDRPMSSKDGLTSSAVVRQSLDDVEVVISTGVGARALTLSKVLKLLVEEGLDVVSCVSIRIDGGLIIHTTQSEVTDLTPVDIPRLQQKPSEEISSVNPIS